MKICTGCGESKPLELFAKRSTKLDGRTAWCKACHTAYHYRRVEIRAAQGRAWREAHPDYFKQYYAANRERRKAEAIAYQAQHLDERRAYLRGWVEKNREKVTTQAREYQRSIGYKHSKARKLAQRFHVVEPVDRNIVYERGNGLCGICGDPVLVTAFQVDHIIPLSRGGVHSYANTQPAHATCNRRKGATISDPPDRDMAA